MSTSPGRNIYCQLSNRESDQNIYQFQPQLYRERLRFAKNLYKTNLIAHYGCVNAIEFSNGGKYLVSGGDDKRVILWDLEKSIAGCDKPVCMYKEHHSNIFCLGFNRSNSKIFSGGNDEILIVHDFETKKIVDVFVHSKSVYGLSIDPVCDNLLATACEDGKITIFDLRKSSPVKIFGRYGGRQSSYHAVQFHPVDDNFLVTANTRKGAAFWDLRSSNRPVIQYGGEENQQSCMSVRFNSRGNLVLALRRRLPPILYNTFSQKPICQFYHPDYYNSCTMKSCCFAGPDEEYVLSGSDDFNLYVWKIADVDLNKVNQLVETTHMVLCGHRSIVNQVRYNQEKCLIASSGVEKVVKLWSPFNQKDWSGDLTDETCGTDNTRELYTQDAYATLVNASANMTHDYSAQNTQEDSRMMAFFDSLIQQEIENWNSNYSSDSEQNSVQSSEQSTRHISSSDDSDNNGVNFYYDRSRRGLNCNSSKPQRTKYANRIAYLIATKRNTLRRLALKGASNSNRRRRQHSFKTKRKSHSLLHRSLGSSSGQTRTTRNGNLSNKRVGRYTSSLPFRSRISAVGLSAGTSTRDDNDNQGLKIARHKRYESVFRALRRKNRSRRQLEPSDTSSDENNSDVKFNFETVRTTNLAIPSTSTGITSSGRDIITRLRQQEQLLDSDTGDDENEEVITRPVNNLNQIPPTNGVIKNNHNNREHETEENGTSTTSSSSSSPSSTSTSTSFGNENHSNNMDLNSIDCDNIEDVNNRSSNPMSIILQTSMVSATSLITDASDTINNLKRCHTINLDIYSSHSNSRLSNSSYLEDNIHSNSAESLDCFLRKKIKLNNHVPQCDDNDDIDKHNGTGNIQNNSNILNTPDSGISFANSSVACSSTSSHSANNFKPTNDSNINYNDNNSNNNSNNIRHNNNENNNSNLQNGDKFAIKLFHQKDARVRRNYRKKFGNDSESD